MILSRITSKAQTTIPGAVRRALGLDSGDRVIWSIDNDGKVTVRRFALVDPADPFVNNFSTFTEWADELDEEAFRDL
jgi:antitoxin PrlF